MSIKRTLAVILAAMLAACGGPDEGGAPDESGPDGGYGPGVEIDLNQLIGAPSDSGFLWVTSGTADPNSAAVRAGLSLTPAGKLTLPDCRYSTMVPVPWPFTVTVQAMQNSVEVYRLTITADERFISSAVVCYIPSGETLCHNPTEPITVEVGATIQWYSLVKATCTTTYSPALPAGACPASDPNYAFCR